jgi:hypothetical protein
LDVEAETVKHLEPNVESDEQNMENVRGGVTRTASYRVAGCG